MTVATTHEASPTSAVYIQDVAAALAVKNALWTLPDDTAGIDAARHTAERVRSQAMTLRHNAPTVPGYAIERAVRLQLISTEQAALLPRNNLPYSQGLERDIDVAEAAADVADVRTRQHQAINNPAAFNSSEIELIQRGLQVVIGSDPQSYDALQAGHVIGCYPALAPLHCE